MPGGLGWMPVRDDLKPDDPIASISAEDWNKVARFVNELYAETGEIQRNADGRRPRIPSLNAGLLAYLAANFVQGGGKIFPAEIQTGGTSFDEQIYDESANDWIDRTDGQEESGTIEQFWHGGAKSKVGSVGWVIKFTGDEDTELYFGVMGFIDQTTTPSNGDLLQYDVDGGDEGPIWDDCVKAK